MTTRLLAPLGAALLLAAGCDAVAPTNPFDPAAPPEVQARAHLSGSVFSADDEGDTPLAGATVTLRAADGAETVATTDDDGEFRFADLAPGAWALDAVHPQHLRQGLAFDLAAGETRGLTLTLQPIDALSDETGQVFGTVQRAGELLQPAAEQDHGGIVVDVVGTGVRTVTNPSGRFDVFLQAGDYELSFATPNYVTQTVTGIVIEGGAAAEMPDSPLVLQPNPGSVAGRALLEGADATGNADVLVTVGDQTGTTAPDGSWMVTGLAAGTYTVRATRDGYVAAERDGVVVDGGRTTTITPMTLAIARGDVVGRVTLTGETDFSGITVGLTGTTRTVVSNASGDFAIDDVEVGTYELTARRDGFVTGVVGSVVVLEGESTDVGTIQLANRLGDFDINGGAAYTNDPAVTLDLVADDAVSMRISQDATFTDAALGDTDFVTFQSSASFTLTGEDGSKVVYVQYEDSTQVASEVFSSSIVLDRAAPHSAAIEINDGAAYSNNADGIVTLTLLALDDTSGVESVQLSTDGTFDTEPRDPFTGSRVFALPDAQTDGARTVTARFFDRAGNVTDTPVSATITLDRELPVLNDFAVSCRGVADADYCNTELVTLVTDATGAAFLAASNDQGFAVEVFQPFGAAVSHLLSPGDEEKTVYIKLMDEAGNVTTAFSDALTLDTVPPSGTVSAADGASRVGTRTVSVTGAGLSEPVTYALGSDSVDCNTATYSATASTTLDDSTDLADEQGTRTVEVCLRDRAGNVTKTSDTVELDQTAPSGTLELLVDADYTNQLQLPLRISDASDDTAGVHVAEATTLDCASLTDGDFSPFAPVGNVTLSGVNGSRTVYACIRDDVDNRRLLGPVDIVFDDVAPTFGGSANLLLEVSSNKNRVGACSGPSTDPTACQTNDATPRATWSAATDANASPVSYVVQFATVDDFQPVVAQSGVLMGTTSYTPSGDIPDGNWFWRLRAIDQAGNVRNTQAMAFRVDTTPPDTPTLSDLIGRQSGDVVLSWSAVAGAEEYTLNVLAGGTGSVFASPPEIVTGTNYTLLNGTHLSNTPNTPHAAFLRAVDLVGNTSGAALEEFVYDTQAPCANAAAVQIEGGANFTSDEYVNVGIGCSGEVPVEMRLDCDGSFTDWLAFAPSYTCSLDAASDGVKTVAVEARDGAGNVRTFTSDTITLDTQPPLSPTLTPGSAVGVNYSCAKVQIVEDDATIDDNLLGWMVRVNGGAWQPRVPDGSRKVQVNLSQDVTNLIEVRAIDRAQNIGESSSVILEEESSALVPTSLDLKMLCGQGSGMYAILRGTVEWPPVLGFASAGTGASVAYRALPQIDLLALESLANYPFSGAGGMAAALGADFQSAEDWSLVVDAACSRQNEWLVFTFLDHSGTTTFGNGETYTVSWQDPIELGVSGGGGKVGPWGGGNPAGDLPLGLGLATIDAVIWSTPPAYTAQVTDVELGNLGTIFERTRQIGSDGVSTTVTNPINYGVNITGLTTPRQVFGLARDGTGSAWLRWNDGLTRWELWNTTNHTGGTATRRQNWPEAAGFGLKNPPIGSRVKQASYVQGATSPPTRYVVWSDQNGDAFSLRADRDDTQNPVQMGNSAPAYHPLFDRGAAQSGWIDNKQPNRLRLSNNYTNESNVVSYRYGVDDTKAIYATRNTADGAPFIVYQTDSPTKGVVVGFNDEAGCFND